jgi:hypothetical protein
MSEDEKAPDELGMLRKFKAYKTHTLPAPQGDGFVHLHQRFPAHLKGRTVHMIVFLREGEDV